jgi:hypothetical protein
MSAFGQSDMLAITQMQVTDYQNMMTVMTQMYAADQTNRMQRWKIMQDAQMKTFEINQTVTFDSANIAKKLADKWDGYVKGGGG